MPTKKKSKAVEIIRAIYLYLVSAITIVMIIIASVSLINLVFKEYVFDVQSYQEINTRFQCENKPNDFRPAQSYEDCVQEAKENAAIQHKNDIKRDLAWSFSMLLVAIPLFLYHWSVIKRDARK